MSNQLTTSYEAEAVEQKWLTKWADSAIGQAGAGSKKQYTITIPPPNVTGSLHMGHALCYSIHDLLGRYKRMQGYDVLILPGTDHAGIATQSVVIKNLKAQGVDTSKLSREELVKEIWRWREKSGGQILEQFKRLGHLFDWNRIRFTLDEGYERAVLYAFIELFDQDLIYRGKRVINWDPVLKTSVSDIETERRDVKGKLYHIRYEFTDGTGSIVIATTRPETILADVAVAVHPDDERYKGHVGKTLSLPLLGREIPLIADAYPDPEFGTGAVKITPGHDPNDFEVGERHNLPILVAFDESCRINELGERFQGLSREQARKVIVEELEASGALVEVEDHEMSLLVSDRSKEIIEPLASEQWFVRQTELAKGALQHYSQGKTTFVPSRYASVYTDWLENIRDWCISRQLWWGHRIPVFYTASGKAVAAVDAEKAAKKAGEEIVRQDEDVLDTWFSSALWPFATQGWPEIEPDRYPTDVLITSRDIIYLWVARMTMMSAHFLKEAPFNDVFIYAQVQNEKGQRMSKSLGTGVDPLELIQQYGADALRMSLLGQTGDNQDIRFSPKRVEDAARLCNKLWNASRFIQMKTAEHAISEDFEPTGTVDRWILTRLNQTVRSVDEALERYAPGDACSALIEFFWSDFCDWYIELSKDRLTQPQVGDQVASILHHVLKTVLKLLHPVIPFITDEISETVFGTESSLCVTGWPQINPDFEFESELDAMVSWSTITQRLRALRADVGVAAMKPAPEAFIESDLGPEGMAVVASQAWIQSLKVGTGPKMAVQDVVEGIQIAFPLDSVEDPAAELEKLAAEVGRLTIELKKIDARLNNPQFAERAKPEVVERDRAAADQLRERLRALERRRTLFESALTPE